MSMDSSALAALATDPLLFVRVCWPDMQLYEKQREILLSLRDNGETFVHAANELGKTRIAAVAVIWFFASRTPARVITSSSSETQLASILWSEVRHLIETSRVPLPFEVKTLGLRKYKAGTTHETEPMDYVLGYVTNMVENFQGHHLPNDKSRVLAVFDEASGVPDAFFDAADSWVHRKLVIGNPYDKDGDGVIVFEDVKGIQWMDGGKNLDRDRNYFARLDADQDRRVTWKEYRSVSPRQTAFGAIDHLQIDNGISKEEWEAVEQEYLAGQSGEPIPPHARSDYATHWFPGIFDLITFGDVDSDKDGLISWKELQAFPD